MMLVALIMESEWFNQLTIEEQVKVNQLEDLVLLHMEWPILKDQEQPQDKKPHMDRLITSLNNKHKDLHMELSKEEAMEQIQEQEDKLDMELPLEQAMTLI